MFRIWIGNLGKYNEGELVGEWVDLPCDDFDEVFERIGIDEHYEETFIADFENDYGYHVDEYDNLEMLNEVAEELEELDDDEQDVYASLSANSYDHDEIMRIIHNGDYALYSECDSMGDVAYEVYEQMGKIEEIEETLPSYYIDWDAIGNDLEINGNFYEYANGYVEVW